jgi:transposase
MPPKESPLAEISDTQEPTPGGFSPAYVARLLCENIRLREENQALREQAIWSRGNANYYKRMHRKALERLEEKDGQVEALQSKVCELKHRLFGRKTERSKAAKSDLGLIGPKLKRGQQRGAVGHGRKIRENLPVLEVEVLPPAEQIFCAHCNKPWVLLGEPEVSEAIEWEVRLFRKRTKRPKFRRPQGCTCADGRADIVCAPVPSSLIPKGLLGISFIVQALLLKFLHGMPAHRLGRMIEGEGMPLSAGTLCGVFQKIAPLFLPLYEGILACSRRQDLALMDESRWEVFVETEGKTSHRWWLWVVVTSMTRFYILSPSRSSAVPKEYFGYDQENKTHAHHKQVMADRYPGYSFLKAVLDLAYCWAHVRRDFLEERSEEKDRAWTDLWVARIGEIYTLNKARLALGCALAPKRALPAPFVELDAARMKSPQYQEADKRLREAVEKMAATRREELEGKDLRIPRRKVLQSLEAHWHGLTLFVEHPQIPMDNNGAERAVRPAAIARKNFYGSGAKWSGDLMAMLMSLFQTLLLHQVDPRKYLTAYLQACADNSSQPPGNIEPWMPWNFSTQKTSSQESGHIPGDVPGPSP